LLSPHRPIGIPNRTVLDAIECAIEVFQQHDLFYGHGTTSADEEALYLVKHALDLQSPDGRGDSLDISQHYQQQISDQQWGRVGMLVAQRVKERLPAAYITGTAWLGGVPFHVSKDVIIPRSFIMEILQHQHQHQQSDSTNNNNNNSSTSSSAGARVPLQLVKYLGSDVTAVRSVLDMCTGSGCLAILLARAFPEARIDAVDISNAALEVADTNIRQQALAHRIDLHQADMFGTPSLHGRTFDLIVANPPYVSPVQQATLPHEFHHEPQIALFGDGADGLGHIDRLLRQAPTFLTKRGVLVCEAAERRKEMQRTYHSLALRWLRTSGGYDRVFLATANWLRKWNASEEQQQQEQRHSGIGS
jgi:ribosomal protein L3 glutamine methyltransferase